MVFQSKIEPPIWSDFEECMPLNMFLDFSQYFPEKMLVSDSVTFLKDYAFCDMMDDSILLGCLIFLVDKEEPFYFSHAMIQNMSTKLLQSLMVDFAKQKAKEVIDGSESGSLDADCEIMQKSNNRRIGRGASWKKRKKRDSLSSDKSVSYGITPLVTIANAIAQEYPDLAEIQMGYEINFEARIPQWNNEKGKFHEDCTKVVEVDIVKLRTMKILGALIRSCSKMTVAYNEESFQSAFKSVCYFLQLLTKYPKSLINAGKEQNGKAQDVIDMFLSSCAADFTRHLTEYMSCSKMECSRLYFHSIMIKRCL
jgi:hypothetical protein